MSAVSGLSEKHRTPPWAPARVTLPTPAAPVPRPTPVPCPLSMTPRRHLRGAALSAPCRWRCVRVGIPLPYTCFTHVLMFLWQIRLSRHCPQPAAIGRSLSRPTPRIAPSTAAWRMRKRTWGCGCGLPVASPQRRPDAMADHTFVQSGRYAPDAHTIAAPGVVDACSGLSALSEAPRTLADGTRCVCSTSTRRVALHKISACVPHYQSLSHSEFPCRSKSLLWPVSHCPP